MTQQMESGGRRSRAGGAITVALAAMAWLGGDALADRTVEEAFRGLSAGPLAWARLDAGLTNAVLACGDIRLAEADLVPFLEKLPPGQRGKAAFFMLENAAADKLLLAEARQAARAAGVAEAARNDRDCMREAFAKVAGRVTVAEAETREFYDRNRAACGEATLEQAKDSINAYLLGQKQEEAIEAHVRGLGQRLPIRLNEAWVTKQAALALDNPVDRARASGKPSLVDFGAAGCGPCEMMVPVLEALRKSYAGKANVVFVHVPDEPVLGGRYGIQGVPVQVFFDKSGAEVFRHVGFFSQAEIEKKMAELGAE